MTIPTRNGFRSTPINGTNTPEVGQMMGRDCEFLIWEFLKNAEDATDNLLIIFWRRNVATQWGKTHF
jgi:hypothetical protein